MTELSQILLLLVPLLLVEMGMRIYVILDILKEERRVLWGKKLIWILISGIITLGWAVYLVVGREE